MYNISMKRKGFIMDISPSITEQAEFLKIHAHCIGYRISSTCKEKYYIYDHLDYKTGIIKSYGYVVYYEKKNKMKDYLPIRITKSSPRAVQLMVDAIGLHFGE